MADEKEMLPDRLNWLENGVGNSQRKTVSMVLFREVIGALRFAGQRSERMADEKATVTREPLEVWAVIHEGIVLGAFGARDGAENHARYVSRLNVTRPPATYVRYVVPAQSPAGEVTREHREAALRIARAALVDDDDGVLPERIQEWIDNSAGSPIDVSATVWLGTLSEALASAYSAGQAAGKREGDSEWVRVPEGTEPDLDDGAECWVSFRGHVCRRWWSCDASGVYWDSRDERQVLHVWEVSHYQLVRVPPPPSDKEASA